MKTCTLRNSGQRFEIWLQWTAAEFHRSSEHKGGFQLIQKSRSWHIPLWRSQAAGINCVHRWCSDCWSSLCMRIRTVSLPNTTTSTHFSPSLFPSPLLHPKIPLAIKMPSVSAKHGYEWRTINKEKRVDLENCQFRSESLHESIRALSKPWEEARPTHLTDSYRWVLVKNRMANFLSAFSLAHVVTAKESILSAYQQGGRRSSWNLQTFHVWAVYVYSWRRGPWRFAAFVLQQMSFRSTQTVTECTKVNILFLKEMN